MPPCVSLACMLLHVSERKPLAVSEWSTGICEREPSGVNLEGAPIRSQRIMGKYVTTAMTAKGWGRTRSPTGCWAVTDRFCGLRLAVIYAFDRAATKLVLVGSRHRETSV
ncbi:hypothetical protein AAFF_G00434090 [Aldrovandia affinis]|uniref:Uncharacterized protein n=1 Tax=Aldrovandia affinis TaxID=143900 RepID=A0AAD7S845_9TELE|nr:hypothetical protein AAFF_G00434090 [Aldrovandia affinis]